MSSKTLTASEKVTLLRYASSLPSGDKTRRAIVAAVGKTAALNAKINVRVMAKGFVFNFQTSMSPVGLSTESMGRLGERVRTDARTFVERLAVQLDWSMDIDREGALVLLGVEGNEITLNLEVSVANNSRKKLTAEDLEGAFAALKRFGYAIAFV
jgi:hypothetical protein